MNTQTTQTMQNATTESLEVSTEASTTLKESSKATATLCVPELLKNVKRHVAPEKHAMLDDLLARYESKQLGKQQLQFELRIVAGREALRAALLSMFPDLKKKREMMNQAQPCPPVTALTETFADHSSNNDDVTQERVEQGTSDDAPSVSPCPNIIAAEMPESIISEDLVSSALSQIEEEEDGATDDDSLDQGASHETSAEAEGASVPPPPSKHPTGKSYHVGGKHPDVEHMYDGDDGAGSEVEEEEDGATDSDSLDQGASHETSAEAEGVSVPPPMVGPLEHQGGTKLKVRWGKMPRKPVFIGEVMGIIHRDDGVTLVEVYYRCDGKTEKHDFAGDGCSIVSQEPPIYRCTMLRRTSTGYEGKLTPGDGKHWPLTTEDVEEHYRAAGESHFLKTLGNKKFKHVPAAGKAKKGARGKPKVKPPPSKPDCVLGALDKAWRADGDTTAAQKACEQIDASILSEDRMKYAANLGVSQNYEPQKIKGGCALDMATLDHVVLLQLRSSDGTCRAHAVALLRGLIYDSAQPEPLPLTRANLTECLGVEYGGVVRGYQFVPQVKARKRKMAMEGASEAKRERVE